MVDVSVNVYTGAGFLVLFEPAAVAPHVGPEIDWCADEEVLLNLANQGLLVPLNIGADGVWLCRVTTTGLAELEQQVVLQTESDFWLDVGSHEVVIGGLEALQTRDGAPDRFVDEFGHRIPFEQGRYKVTVYRLVGPHCAEIEERLTHSDVPCWVLVCQPLLPGEAPPHINVLPNLSMFQA